MSFKQFSSTQDAQTNDKPDGKAKAAPVTAQPAQKTCQDHRSCHSRRTKAVTTWTEGARLLRHSPTHLIRKRPIRLIDAAATLPPNRLSEENCRGHDHA